LERINKINLDKFEIDYDNQFVSFPKIQLHRNDYPNRVIGENGCGKSSLILSLAGVIPEYLYGKPSLTFNIYTDINTISFPDNQKYFRIIPQKWKYGILGFFPLEEVQLVNSAREAWCKEVISELEINNLNHISSNYLSDGEKKRLMICKTLCAFPSMIISDEWTTHLDNYWTNKIQSLFNQYFAEGGFHLEFHSENSLHDTDVIVKTQQTNSEYLKRKELNIDFLKKVLESSFKHSEFSIRRYVSYYGENRKKNIELQIANGQLIQLYGKNGAGKTTLLRNLWKNSFFVHKRILNNVSKNPKILFIPTDPSYHIIGPTVKDEFKKVIAKNYHEEAEDFFKSLIGININRDVLSLSFGQRKLLAITLGIFSNYPIICVDEAFSGLDALNHKIIVNLFKESVLCGKTIIYTDQENRNILNLKSLQV
jgi:ABC-type multidrug transport system ATPase subunit